MNYRTLIAIVLCLWIPFAVAGPFAKEANENPFLSGELNPQYEGELTALGGEVLEIKPEPEGGIKVGDMMIFKGFISTAKSADPDGDLERLINSKTLLMAIQSQRPN